MATFLRNLVYSPPRKKESFSRENPFQSGPSLGDSEPAPSSQAGTTHGDGDVAVPWTPTPGAPAFDGRAFHGRAPYPAAAGDAAAARKVFGADANARAGAPSPSGDAVVSPLRRASIAFGNLFRRGSPPDVGGAATGAESLLSVGRAGSPRASSATERALFQFGAFGGAPPLSAAVSVSPRSLDDADRGGTDGGTDGGSVETLEAFLARTEPSSSCYFGDGCPAFLLDDRRDIVEYLNAGYDFETITRCIASRIGQHCTPEEIRRAAMSVDHEWAPRGSPCYEANLEPLSEAERRHLESERDEKGAEHVARKLMAQHEQLQSLEPVELLSAGRPESSSSSRPRFSVARYELLLEFCATKIVTVGDDGTYVLNPELRATVADLEAPGWFEGRQLLLGFVSLISAARMTWARPCAAGSVGFDQAGGRVPLLFEVATIAALQDHDLASRAALQCPSRSPSGPRAAIRACAEEGCRGFVVAEAKHVHGPGTRDGVDLDAETLTARVVLLPERLVDMCGGAESLRNIVNEIMEVMWSLKMDSRVASRLESCTSGWIFGKITPFLDRMVRFMPLMKDAKVAQIAIVRTCAAQYQAAKIADLKSFNDSAHQSQIAFVYLHILMHRNGRWSALKSTFNPMLNAREIYELHRRTCPGGTAQWHGRNRGAGSHYSTVRAER